MKKIVLIRHGKSVWNVENKFTGWTDVELSYDGLLEARKAGKILKQHGFIFDVGYTSYLTRAIRTLWIILHELDLMWIPVYKCWKLNERHYGALQGLNKEETAIQFGKEQVEQWRRSIDVAPPPLTKEDQRYPGHEQRYDDIEEEELPVTENLAQTQQRVLEMWNEQIVPDLKEGKKIIISAHGNTLRGLIHYLDQLDDDGVANLNIPTATPLVYELDDDLQPIRHYYLSLEGEITEGDIATYIDL